MKNFISKNWKNIFIIIGGIFILIDLLTIISTPATIPQDFLEYGPNIESDIFDTVNDTVDDTAENIKDGNISDASTSESGESVNIVTNISEKTGIPPELSRGLLFVGAAIIIIVILSSIIEGSGSADKNKKKK